MKNQYTKEFYNIINRLSSQKKKEYFGIIRSVREDNKVANVEIVNVGIITLLNKTGECLSVGDSVIVYAIEGDLSNAFITLRYGESNTELPGSGSTSGEMNKIDIIKVNNIVQQIQDKTVNINVPTKTSDIINDSKYQNETEVSEAIQKAIEDATFDQVMPINDWNDAIQSGFYYSNSDAKNAPTFTGGSNLYGIVFCYDKQVRQVVMPQFGNDCKIRFCSSYDSDTWCEWQSFLPNASASVNGLLSSSDKIKLDGSAPLASPLFTGIPKAPTPDTSDSSVQIATTAFVKAQKYASSSHTHTASEVGAVDQKNILSNSDIEDILNS